LAAAAATARQRSSLGWCDAATACWRGGRRFEGSMLGVVALQQFTGQEFVGLETERMGGWFSGSQALSAGDRSAMQPAAAAAKHWQPGLLRSPCPGVGVSPPPPPPRAPPRRRAAAA
jgi:hypothetical protein